MAEGGNTEGYARPELHEKHRGRQSKIKKSKTMNQLPARKPLYKSLYLQVIAAIIIGGVASVWGSILGAAFVFALPPVLDQLQLLPSNSTGHGFTSGDLSTILYGLLIVLFLLFEPSGIIGLLRRMQRILLAHLPQLMALFVFDVVRSAKRHDDV